MCGTARFTSLVEFSGGEFPESSGEVGDLRKAADGLTETTTVHATAESSLG